MTEVEQAHSSEEDEESSDEEAVAQDNEAGQEGEQMEEEDEGTDLEGMDEDELEERELNAALASGLLKPGMNVMGYVPETQLERRVDEAMLEKKLLDIKQYIPWVERLDMMNRPAPLAPELVLQEEEHQKIIEKRRQNSKDKNLKEDDIVHNDFKREMMFYRQAQAAVLEGIPRLNSMNIPTRRPDDYFAQMLKSDQHMGKIREKLLSKQKMEERRQKVRRIRELKKFGKQVQVEVEQNKVKAKKDLQKNVKDFRKGKLQNLDFLNSDRDLEEDQDFGRRHQNKGPNKRRQFKNEKYSYGTKKDKKNTKDSFNDVSSYGDSRFGGGFGPKKKGGAKVKSKNGAAKRQGKDRRKKQR